MNKNCDTPNQETIDAKNKEYTQDTLLQKVELLDNGRNGIIIHHGKISSSQEKIYASRFSGVVRDIQTDSWRIFSGSNKNDQLTSYVEVPKDIAKIVKIALYANVRQYRTKNEELISAATMIKCASINCHRFLAYILDVSSLGKKESSGWDKVVYFFPKEQYKHFDSYDEFAEYAFSVTKNKHSLMVGQVVYKDELRHSFLLAINKNDKVILCMDKQNSEHAPFRIVPGNWIFNPTSKKEGEEATIAIMPFKEANKMITQDIRIKK